MNFEPLLDALSCDLKPLDELPNHQAWVLGPVQSRGSQQAAPGRVRATDPRPLRPGGPGGCGRSQGRRMRPTSRPPSPTDPDLDRADHQRQEGVPVHPGGLLQAELPDGTATVWTGQHADRQPRVHGSPPDGQHWVKTEGGRPGRRRGRQPADGADRQGDQQQPGDPDHRRPGHGDAGDGLLVHDRPLRDRQAGQAPPRRLRRDRRRPAHDPQPDRDRRRVRGALPRLQPDAPQPGRHAAGAPRGQQRPRPQGRRAAPRRTSPSSR